MLPDTASRIALISLSSVPIVSSYWLCSICTYSFVSVDTELKASDIWRIRWLIVEKSSRTLSRCSDRYSDSRYGSA